MKVIKIQLKVQKCTPSFTFHKTAQWSRIGVFASPIMAPGPYVWNPPSRVMLTISFLKKWPNVAHLFKLPLATGTYSRSAGIMQRTESIQVKSLLSHSQYSPSWRWMANSKWLLLWRLHCSRRERDSIGSRLQSAARFDWRAALLAWHRLQEWELPDHNLCIIF